MALGQSSFLLAGLGAVSAALMFGPRLSSQGQVPQTVLIAGHQAVAGEVLVKFARTQSAGERVLLETQVSSDANETVAPNLRRLHSKAYDTETLLSFLRSQPNIAYAEPNYIIHATATPNDPRFPTLWGLLNTGQTVGVPGVAGADIKATGAWDISTGSRANVVAVIDTGIDYTHPDLAANVWSAPMAFTVNVGGLIVSCAAGTHGYNAITRTCDPMDDHTHGTHVSGTIGAIGNNGVGVVGVNWTASIMAAKFINASGSGTNADAISAIEFTIQTKNYFAATSGANVRVLSNSWGGGGFSQALLDEINKADANNMLFVAAAGNDATNNVTSPSYPASYNAPNVLAVAASDNADQLAYFSNYGSNVQLAAPGVNVLSTTIGNSYQYFNGTSMATPHVSGAAALILSRCPLTTAALMTTIVNNVDVVGALTGWVSTNGRLNVERAIRSCVPTPPDFSIAVGPPSLTLTQGAIGTAPVTVTGVNGFIGSVSLSVTGCPSGATCSFSPVTTTAASTLSVSTTASTITGPFTLTITGTSGSLSHSTTMSSTVVHAVTRTDVALAANGGVATASSTYGGGYVAANAINGDRTGTGWGTTGGWNDATPSVYPDWLEVDFNGAQTINEIDVFSVQDNYQFPSPPTPTMTFTLYGLRNFEAQYWTGSAWADVPGGAIAGNHRVWAQIPFAPVTTTKIRVLVTLGAPNGYTAITEIEAYAGTTTPPPAPVNVALAANGGVATASSTFGSGYVATNAINGDRTGASWGTSGGWNDNTPSVYPDWLEVDFNGAQTINEIDVFSVQDNYQTPIDPTLTTPFTLYGLRNFEAQYWTGSAWADVPGGAITGNDHVWAQISFTPMTTTKIRVLVTLGAPNGYSAITEVEAYAGALAPPPPGPVNVALAANGAAASASSTYSGGGGYGAANAINGERAGASWGTSGGWNDDTPNVYPDWLEVDFNGVQTISEIDIFSVQDNYQFPSAPTPTMTFTLYGLRNFEAQYWTGSAWIDVPGGAVTGNNHVWVQIPFAPITTTKIRVLVTLGAPNGYTAIAEVEAYAPPAP